MLIDKSRIEVSSACESNMMTTDKYMSLYVYRTLKEDGQVGYVIEGTVEGGPKTASANNVINKYNTREAYIYGITYPFEVAVLPSAKNPLSITTNDGLILLIDPQTETRSWRLYDLFEASEYKDSKFDSDLNTEATIYKSTTSLSPINEHLLMLYPTSGAARYPLMVAKYENDQTVFLGTHHLLSGEAPVLYENLLTTTSLDVPVARAVDMNQNYFAIPLRKDTLYLDAITLPNKPFYRIAIYNEYKGEVSLFLDNKKIAAKYLQKLPNLIIIKNPFFVENNNDFVTMKINLSQDKALVGVI